MSRWILGLALLVGGGLAGAAVTAGLAGPLVTLEDPGGDDGSAEAPEDPLVGRGWTYVGIPHVAGPGKGALPVLPLDESGEGWLVGRPNVTTRIRSGNVDEATIDVRPWYTYCGHGDAPGLQTDWTGSEVLRYAARDPYGGDGPTPWYANRTGAPVNPEEVPVGKPFYATWRTPPDAEGTEILLFGLLKRNASAVPDAPWDLPVAEDGILAWFAPATHYCAVTRTQPIVGHPFFDKTVLETPRYPWLEGVPHLVRDTVHVGAWDPNRLVVDKWSQVGWPAAGGGTTGVPPRR